MPSGRRPPIDGKLLKIADGRSGIGRRVERPFPDRRRPGRRDRRHPLHQRQHGTAERGRLHARDLRRAGRMLSRRSTRIEPGEVDLCTFPLFALFAPALGMTSVVPEMDATRPAHVDPVKIIQAIETFGATNLFGSPAALETPRRLRRGAGSQTGFVAARGLGRAPVPARRLGISSRRCSIPASRSSLPMGRPNRSPSPRSAAIEILGETRHATEQGAGVCVGQPVAGMRVEVMRISDEPIEVWSDDLHAPDGEIGEFVVHGPVVTQAYYQRPEADRACQDPRAGGFESTADAPHGRSRLSRRTGPPLVLRAEGPSGRNARAARCSRSLARRCSTRIRK